MRKKLSLLSLFLSLLVFFSGAAAQKEERQITIYATVTNKAGDFVLELKEKNFQLFEGKTEKRISAFSDRPEPMSIGFLIDLSGSMLNPVGDLLPDRVSRIREGIFNFLDDSGKENEYFVITFNDKINMLQEFTSSADDIKKVVAEGTKAPPKGHTKVNDAIYAALKKVSAGVHKKKVLIVATDAQDNESSYNLSQLRQAVRDSETLLYVVNIQAGSFFSLGQSASAADVTGITGGRTFITMDGINRDFLPQTKETFQRLAQELKNQYRIKFEASPAADGKNKWREIKLKIDVPAEARKKIGFIGVRTRQGYYPVSDAVVSGQN